MPLWLLCAAATADAGGADADGDGGGGGARCAAAVRKSSCTENLRLPQNVHEKYPAARRAKKQSYSHLHVTADVLILCVLPNRCVLAPMRAT